MFYAPYGQTSIDKAFVICGNKPDQIPLSWLSDEDIKHLKPRKEYVIRPAQPRVLSAELQALNLGGPKEFPTEKAVEPPLDPRIPFVPLVWPKGRKQAEPHPIASLVQVGGPREIPVPPRVARAPAAMPRGPVEEKKIIGGFDLSFLEPLPFAATASPWATTSPWERQSIIPALGSPEVIEPEQAPRSSARRHYPVRIVESRR